MTRGRSVSATILATAALLLSACSSPQDEPTPTPTQSSPDDDYRTTEPPVVPIADHDGFVAMPSVCQWIDWTSVERMGETEPARMLGYSFNKELTPPPAEALCGLDFTDNVDYGLTDVFVRADIWDTAEDATRQCELNDSRDIDAEPVWDHARLRVKEGDEPFTVQLQDGVLCIQVLVRPGDDIWNSLDDPAKEFTAVALSLAGGIREGSLRESYPDLPSPAAS